MSATEGHEHAPFIDYQNLPAPTEGILVTHFITVRSVARSHAFYSKALGGQVAPEENPCIVKLANSWVLMNPGGPPTPDKPDISVVNYEPGNTVSTFINLRVADIQACYEQRSAKGAEHMRPPFTELAGPWSHPDWATNHWGADGITTNAVLPGGSSRRTWHAIWTQSWSHGCEQSPRPRARRPRGSTARR